MTKKEIAFLSLGLATAFGVGLAYLAKVKKDKYLITGVNVR